jgi:predicted enzyme related to lactoylglutathione lyase
MREENRIDYVEIPVTDPAQARDFFAALMGWEFQEWGDDYISFNDGRLDGGFRRADKPAPAEGVLVVFFSTDLERDRDRVVELGATITRRKITESLHAHSDRSSMRATQARVDSRCYDGAQEVSRTRDRDHGIRLLRGVEKHQYAGS